MPGFLFQIHIDFFSFIVGFLFASLLWWFGRGMRAYWPKIRQEIKNRSEALQRANYAALEERFRKETLRRAQGTHIFSSLFALDEILIEPRVLLPLPQIQPEKAPPVETIVTHAISYLPDWPEFPRHYHYPTLTLPAVMSRGCNILLTGQPGQGKSVALASLAAQACRRNPTLGSLSNALPLYVHITDFAYDVSPVIDPAGLLIDAVSTYLPTISRSQAPKFIRPYFDQNNVLVIIDGLDELSTPKLKQATEFLRALLQQYPQTRLVTTGSSEYWDGLVELGLLPVAAAGWDQQDAAGFLNKLSDLWAKEVSPLNSTSDVSKRFDPELVGRWIQAEFQHLSPLEWSLKGWAAFTGDFRGSTCGDDVEAWADRLIPAHFRPVLEKLALKMVMAGQLTIPAQEVDSALGGTGVEKTSMQPVKSPANGPASAPIEGSDAKPSKTPQIKTEEQSTRRPTSALIQSGLLQERLNGQVAFNHPVLCSLLASRALFANQTKSKDLLIQQNWTGKNLVLRHLSTQMDISHLVNSILRDDSEPLFRNLMLVSRWLKYAPLPAAWRGVVLRKLVENLQNPSLPLGIRQRCLAALVCSHDLSLPAVFRQNLSSGSSEQRAFYGLGLGLLQDQKSTTDLVGLLNDADESVRDSACLALTSIGSRQAIETITRLLLQGDERSRRAAAEALSKVPNTGEQVLKEGATFEDLLVRRAVVFGLQQIEAPWAGQLLQKMSIEDGQWIVRNAATQANENLQHSDRLIPQPLPQPSHSAWLIQFAGKQGIGIPAGSAATELLLLALKTGSEEEQIASLEYLRIIPSPEVAAAIYDAAFTGSRLLREHALDAIQYSASSGSMVFPTEQMGSMNPEKISAFDRA